MGFGKIFSIIDKLLPGRKEKVQNDINKLEKDLEFALQNGNDIDVAIISERLRKLRAKIGNTD